MKKNFGKKSELSLNFNTTDTLRAVEPYEIIQEEGQSNSMIQYFNSF